MLLDSSCLCVCLSCVYVCPRSVVCSRGSMVDDVGSPVKMMVFHVNYIISKNI